MANTEFPGDLLETIRSLHDRATGEAQATVQWYQANKKWKRIISKALRISAILLTTVAGLIPALVSLQLLGLDQAEDVQWVYLFLGLAAGCVGLDKFFGLSTGWMRNTRTQMAVEKALAEFEVDWAIETATLTEKDLTPESGAKILKLIKDFRLKVHRLSEEETLGWVDEFESSLVRLQKEVSEKKGGGS